MNNMMLAYSEYFKVPFEKQVQKGVRELYEEYQGISWLQQVETNLCVKYNTYFTNPTRSYD